MKKNALIAGTTGLVGLLLLHKLLDSPAYDKVYSVARKKIDLAHPKLEQLLVNFDQLSENLSEIQVEDVFCCLGTTMKKAGSKEFFKKVDLDYVVSLAEIMYHNGAKQFLVITAMGADKNSFIYYNSIKGQAEEALKNIGFDTLHILRPSLIMGEREEHRLGESLAQKVMPVFDILLKGYLKKYATIPAYKIADKMLYLANQNIKGSHVHLSDSIH
jgi:uncharacterized protein YbjT (DUF2867 family)